MKELLTENLNKLAAACPYPLYVVGGRVRNYLAGLPDASDTDICAPAAAEDLVERARSVGFCAEAVFRNTGTVKLRCGGESYEFASFRSDEYIRGEHRPARSFFTDDILLDARRRDFKCNAVYYDIVRGEFVDPLGGIADIGAKTLSCVAPAEKVFSEDGLRLMRLARIAAQTGFTPTRECVAGAAANSALILDVHAERVWAELEQILHADGKYGFALAQYRGLKLLHEIGVLERILPEVTAGEGIVQRKDFHKYDVLEHSLRAVAYADDGVRLAALLHDVGKPYCLKISSSFVGHEEEGARLAGEICARLKVPKKLAEETVRLVALHMYDFRCDAKENKLRKFVLANCDLLDKIVAIKQADFSACKDDRSLAPSARRLTDVYAKMKEEGLPFSLKELAVKGDDLLAAGFPPETVGKTLESLLGDCAIKLVANDRERLLVRAEKVYLRPIRRAEGAPDKKIAPQSPSAADNHG